MAVPSYGTDIVTLDGSVYTATGGTSLVVNDYAAVGGGQAGLNEETDYYLIGTECISKNAFGNGSQEKGIVDDTNAGGNIATTLASGNNPGGNQYVYIWMFFNAPASLATAVLPLNQRGGLHAIIGPNTNNYNAYSVSGSDLQDYGADWVCGSIDVNVTPANGLALTTVGNGAGGNYSVFGAGASIPTQGPTKGAPFAIEGIRRGAYIDAVEGETANPVTFAGLEGFDGGDNINGRLGVFTERRGVYILNTEVRLGSSTQLCFMRDTSGVTIRRQNDATPWYSNTETDGGKHRIQILNSSSDIEWENVTILEDAIDILINSTDNPIVKFTACSFFGVRLLQCGGANTELTRCTFGTTSATITSNTMAGTNTEARVIQNGATITSCTVNGTSNTAETSGIEVSGTNATDLSKITNCNFTGNGRALLLGQIAGGQGDVTVIYDGHSFTPNAQLGYNDGAVQSATTGPQGNSGAVIEVEVLSGTNLIISVSNTSQIPSVYNTGSGQVTIQADVSVSISGVLGNSEVSIMQSPSPYSQNGATRTTLFNEDTVAAVTGTDIEFVTVPQGAGPVLFIDSTTTDFTNITGLAVTTPPQVIRVTHRDNLALFDEFEVVSISANTIGVTAVGQSSIKQQDLVDSPGETVTVEKVDATYTFNVPSGTDIDVLIYRVGSLPVYLLEQTITTENASFPISQSLDRNYDSFEV